MHGKSGYDLHVFAYKHDILGNNLVHDKSGYTVNRGMTVIALYNNIFIGSETEQFLCIYNISSAKVFVTFHPFLSLYTCLIVLFRRSRLSISRWIFSLLFARGPR